MREVKKNAIFKHFKGHFYRIETICYLESFNDPYVVYHRCDEHGIFISIREKAGQVDEKIVNQPFLRSLESFNGLTMDGKERFTFFKQL